MSNIRKIRLLESYVTYEGHGHIILNFDIFPELKDKTNEEIDKYLNDNIDNLYACTNTNELRKDNMEIIDPLEYEEDEEIPQPEEDPDVIELQEYWNDCECVWNKIKNETRTLMAENQDQE